jgi:hypothetical protein
MMCFVATVAQVYVKCGGGSFLGDQMAAMDKESQGGAATRRSGRRQGKE